MSDAILFVHTMKVPAAEMHDFTRALQSAVEFVEANGPHLMVEAYVDESRERAYSFQLYPDSASIRAHWEMSDPYIRDVMKHASVERLDIYGHPDDSVMQHIRELSAAGVEVSVTPNLTGFHRLAPPAPD
ncbi:hypothetical protein [Nesterenkonia xinjiangensis]|uniref:Sugar/nucleoside kinase (Ribokinase family) n=1 Tax=Nesterenkonia xinjiangensis TaxID=225327 RepID=A0A7Z0K8E5_9MICC|nr:hypothetical protein [Nesterenkonia xinjiangensis]NYJ77571.1 sugar/nucleoside kinase (ribokinase family) [Nesterenkonia xinjiangensis]